MHPYVLQNLRVSSLQQLLWAPIHCVQAALELCYCVDRLVIGFNGNSGMLSKPGNLKIEPGLQSAKKFFLCMDIGCVADLSCLNDLAAAAATSFQLQ